MRTEVDPERLPLTILELFRIKQGEMVSALMHLGTRLGLWDAMRETAPCSSDELAEATGLHERWVREWLCGLAAAGVMQHDDGQFALTPEASVLLTDTSYPSFMPQVFGPPMTHREIERTADAFSTGIGMTWDQHGEHTCHMQSALSGARHEALLVPVVLAAFDGAVSRLASGPSVITDVGCGTGVAARRLAKSFPQASVTGIDPSKTAIASARRAAEDAGITNVRFIEGTFDDLDEHGPCDLLVTLDVLHDLPRPQEAIEAAYRSLNDDGWWLVADIKSKGDLEANRKIPVLPFMYAMSVFYCMSSGLSEPDGAGLGTLGLYPQRLEEMTRQAGFGRFHRHEAELDPTNWYYEIRR